MCGRSGESIARTLAKKEITKGKKIKRRKYHAVKIRCGALRNKKKRRNIRRKNNETEMASTEEVLQK
jgi:hypothetical protein